MGSRRFLDRRFLLALLALGSLAAWIVHDRVRYGGLVERASLLYAEAAAFEARGEPQNAYRRYDILCEGIGIKRSDVPHGACEGAQRLSLNIHKAYEDATAALNKYREVSGRYPESLNSVRKDIPESSQAAFSGFRYERESDSRVSIDLGLYGSVTYDLNR
jgi:hypothetical protein